MPSTMSCDGTMIGLPDAGDRMLLVDIISTRASSWASSDSGTWTAIWSPSKSAFEAVQGRGTVQQHRMLADHLLEDVPHLRPLLLDHALGGLDGVGHAVVLQPRVDERLEQLERHLLGQAALVQLELGADHDDRAARVVDALAEQVLAEPALLALQHVAERLQRP